MLSFLKRVHWRGLQEEEAPLLCPGLAGGEWYEYASGYEPGILSLCNLGLVINSLQPS